ncbi:RBBP9/YdeN family alpha/beta hydrolase [Luteimonas saliphila]|uniref:RBBP9/YdeN family alpha/beta hydrolase n=1 Tax=Luteimonas saliphila TaxID=2804919 RepID=UPI00192DA18F|nr:alpha/beta fold hydrolase [Luteimonas saliphila]
MTALLLVLLAVFGGHAPPAEARQAPARVYIVHGYGASPSDHWFPWLRDAMERRGATVSIVELPTPGDPQPDAWLQTLRAQVPAPDQDTWFVAHSLGGIALLRYLVAADAGARIGGFVLVSGFNDRLPILPQLDGFRDPDLDYGRLVRMAGQRVVIAADDDAIVPPPLSQDLARSLEARFVAVARGGHFLGSDGFERFPLVLDELEKAMAAAP